VDAAVATLWMVKLGVAKECAAENLGMEESNLFVMMVTVLDEQCQAEANKADETQHHRGVILHFAGLDESKHAA
jgi:hypothetical protein